MSFCSGGRSIGNGADGGGSEKWGWSGKWGSDGLGFAVEGVMGEEFVAEPGSVEVEVEFGGGY